MCVPRCVCVCVYTYERARARVAQRDEIENVRQCVCVVDE